MIDFFKPDDFLGPAYGVGTGIGSGISIIRVSHAVIVANEKLEKALWDKKVFGDIRENVFFVCDPRVGLKDKSCTHEAYLFLIKPISKEPCKHEHVLFDQENRVSTHNCVYQKAVFKCTACGKELEPVWREKE